MYISDESIARVREAADLVDLASSYLDLQPAGKQMKARCPFHQEKTPSFFISPDQGFFKCFGCGESGDAISFIMKIEHLDFTDAVKFLADRYHIPLEASNPREVERRNFRELCYQINREAAVFFYRNLLKSKEALAYLQKRKLSSQVINRFYLGYADGYGNTLLKHLTGLGFEEELLADLGLIARSNRGTGYYDKFRDRLMFPILSRQKRVVGFGGRAIGDGKPKYLNSPESMIFHKGKELYGLSSLGEERPTDRLLLVEGYMDVIALDDRGLPGAVASLGTALTEDQVALVKRFSKSVYLCYDGDQAGIRASRRAVGLMEAVDLHPKLILLPDGLDPDEYIQKEGLEAFTSFFDKAMDPLDFELKLLQAPYDLTNFQDRSDFLEAALDFLADIGQDSQRDLYSQKIAQLAEVSAESIQNDVQLRREKRQAEEKKKGRTHTASQEGGSWAKSSWAGFEEDPGPYPPDDYQDYQDPGYPDQDFVDGGSGDQSLGINGKTKLASQAFQIQREMLSLIRADGRSEAVFQEDIDFVTDPGLQELLSSIHSLRENHIPAEVAWLEKIDLSPQARALLPYLIKEPALRGREVEKAQELKLRIEHFRLQERKAEIRHLLEDETSFQSKESLDLLQELQEIEAKLKVGRGGLG